MADQNASNCQATMQAPPSGVKVRMYRVGLGDCFLLAFATEDPAKPYYVLIDCGSIGKTEDGPTLAEVVADIKAATCGRIDLLVVSHRHADHIEGFKQPAFSDPNGIKVQNLWLPFLEQLELYGSLWNKVCQVDTAVQAAIAQTQDTSVAEQLRSVSAFVARPAGTAAAQAATPAGSDPASADPASADPASANKAANKKDPCFDPLADIKKFAKPEYRCPADSPLPLPASAGTDTPAGVKLWVLGPPRPGMKPIDYLFLQDPSNPDETYFTSAGLTSDGAFLFGVLDSGALTADELVLRDLSFPFDQNLRIPWEIACQDEFFKQHYGVMGSKPGQKSACSDESQPAPAASSDTDDWRTIDADWLGVAAAAAAQLDNVVNNTTLAVAVDLPKTGKVLMFVGDAQVGNWQSWHQLPWTTPDGKQPLVPDLFRRTVLYKVGHHGSVNATARSWFNPDPKAATQEEPWGLPLMTHPDLVAMLPVDTKVAANKGVKPPGWVMPAPKMYDTLCENTRGRIIRVDTGVETPPPGVDNPWAGLPQPVITRLYDEYVVLDQ